MDRRAGERFRDSANITHSFRDHSKGLTNAIEDFRKAIDVSSSDEEYVSKVKDLEKRLSTILDELSTLFSSVSPSRSSMSPMQTHGLPMIVRFKQWEDFKAQASGAATVSFLYKSEEKTFQTDALKEGILYTFSGQIPNVAELFTVWLSRELSVEKQNVVEGIIALG
jgi:hypothetical protein